MPTVVSIRKARTDPNHGEFILTFSDGSRSSLYIAYKPLRMLYAFLGANRTVLGLRKNGKDMAYHGACSGLIPVSGWWRAEYESWADYVAKAPQ